MQKAFTVDLEPYTDTQKFALKDFLEDVEAHFIQEALVQHGQNRLHSAAAIGLQRTTLVEKIKRLGRLNRVSRLIVAKG